MMVHRAKIDLIIYFNQIIEFLDTFFKKKSLFINLKIGFLRLLLYYHNAKDTRVISKTIISISQIMKILTGIFPQTL